MADKPMDDFLARQRLLVIAPHADDETYGCAGTISRVKSLGGEAFVMLASIGDLAHYGGTESLPEMKQVPADTRLREFQSVMELLKVDDWEVLYSDTSVHLKLDAVPRRDLVALIERDARLSIEAIQPTMLLIPALSYNQDHEALFRACMTAARPGDRGQRHFIPNVLAYDNTSLFWAPVQERFNPNLYVDISDFLPVKLEALRRHDSQLRGSEFHGSVEGLELQSKLRGREVSLEAAEGYMAMRMVF